MAAKIRERDVTEEKKALKTFTMAMDSTLEDHVEDLKRRLGKPSKAEVFRLGLTLLKMAVDARDERQAIAVVDQKGKVLWKVTLPI